MKIEPPSVITNQGDQLKSLVGPDAVKCMEYRTLLIGLKAEAQGMRLTRGMNCTKLAQKATGLKTRDRDILAARVQLLLDFQLGKCIIIEEDKDNG